MDRQETFATGSDGVRIRRKDPMTNYMAVHYDRVEPSYTMDLGDLTKFAVVSRRLERVQRLSPRSRQVLEAFYGDDGARWGQTKHGRLFALYGMTEAGNKWLRRQAERSSKFRDTSKDAPDAAMVGLANDLTLQILQPKPVKQKLFDLIHLQAQELFAEAQKHWQLCAEAPRAWKREVVISRVA